MQDDSFVNFSVCFFLKILILCFWLSLWYIALDEGDIQLLKTYVSIYFWFSKKQNKKMKNFLCYMRPTFTVSVFYVATNNFEGQG